MVSLVYISLFITCVIATSHLDFEERIVNGIPISASKYPWMVSMRELYQVNTANGIVVYTSSHLCGASLIETSPPVILTAAHCFGKLMLNKISGTIINTDLSLPITIALDLNRTVQQRYNEPIDLNVVTQYNTLYVNDPSMIYIHPDYNGTGAPFFLGNDIALIIIDDNSAVDIEIDQLPTIPMQLEPLESCCKDGESLTQIGYGYNTTNGSYTKTLESTVLNYVNGVKCLDAFKLSVNSSVVAAVLKYFYGEDGAIPNKFVCAYRYGTDSCQGDSGGPLFIENTDGDIEIVGVVSFGIGCDTGFPGFWTSTGHFYEWIQNTINGPADYSSNIDKELATKGANIAIMDRFNFVYAVFGSFMIWVYQ